MSASLHLRPRTLILPPAPLIWTMLRHGVIRHEESHLDARFGDEYQAYKARVRRWL